MAVELALDIASGILLGLGALLIVIAAIGMLRFSDLFKRLHAASVAETGGMLCLVAGMLLQSPHWLVAVKLVLIALLLMLTNPVSTHALARAALYDGYRPALRKREEQAASSGHGKVPDGQASHRKAQP